MEANVSPNITDNRFWLQVMGDYARLILYALPTIEATEANRAQQFIAQFDLLLDQARGTLTDAQIDQLNRQAYQATQEIRKYILHLIYRLITEKVVVNMYPTNLNNMVNDTEIYLTQLAAYMKKESARINSALLNLNWLFYLYISANYIGDTISITFFRERKRATEFAELFLNLYHKSFVLNGFRRTGLSNFPSLIQSNEEIQVVMTQYAEYLVELIQLKETQIIIGPLNTLYLDNLYRELCYYMTRLSEVSTVKPPSCDPTVPRKEDVDTRTTKKIPDLQVSQK